MPSVYLQTKSGKEKLGIVPCSKEVFPELVELPTKNRFMLAEELILHFLSKVFSGYKILSKSLMSSHKKCRYRCRCAL